MKKNPVTKAERDQHGLQMQLNSIYRPFSVALHNAGFRGADNIRIMNTIWPEVKSLSSRVMKRVISDLTIHLPGDTRGG